MIFANKHSRIARCANLIGICALCILLIIAIVQYCQFLASKVCPAVRNATIADILVEQRAKIALEMKNFEYPYECFGVDVQQLSDMTPETNGTPVRSIVISSWRTGSTFLGDILNAMPGNFYHYEPLFNFGIKQIRDKVESAQAIENIKRLLYCNFTNLDLAEYYFSHNAHLGSVCEDSPHLCRRAQLLTPFCKLFPIQSMKTVRLRLSLAKQLLEDKDLNVRILLLVRDPRGTKQSRKNCLWCPGIPDCDNIYNLCNDLVSDYQTAEELLKKHRASFRTLRYEDLSVNPYEMTQEILEFFGLPFDPLVKKFLDTHTKVDNGEVYSTYRDSKSVPFSWKQYLLIEEIENIQNKCAKAMELWGYRKIEDFYNYQMTFNPLILPPPFA